MMTIVGRADGQKDQQKIWKDELRTILLLITGVREE